MTFEQILISIPFFLLTCFVFFMLWQGYTMWQEQKHLLQYGKKVEGVVEEVVYQPFLARRPFYNLKITYTNPQTKKKTTFETPKTSSKPEEKVGSKIDVYVSTKSDLVATAKSVEESEFPKISFFISLLAIPVVIAYYILLFRHYGR